MSTRFRDRAEAGRLLAAKLKRYAGRPDVVVLGLPRGGVAVAYEVAKALHVPLDVFVVRKLGFPGQEELAMGAIASGGTLVLNEDVVEALHVPEAAIEAVAEKEKAELLRREAAYRGEIAPVDLRGRIVIVVDDGLATGSTMRAAVKALRKREPGRIVVAVPVGAAQTCTELRQEADEVVCARAPRYFHAVGLWYDDFTQVSDDEVREFLQRAAESQQPTTARSEA